MYIIMSRCVYIGMFGVIEKYQLNICITIIIGMNVVDNLNSVQVINKPCMSSRNIRFNMFIAFRQVIYRTHQNQGLITARFPPGRNRADLREFMLGTVDELFTQYTMRHLISLTEQIGKDHLPYKSNQGLTTSRFPPGRNRADYKMYLYWEQTMFGTDDVIVNTNTPCNI